MSLHTKRKLKINIKNKKENIKIENICKQYQKETGEELSLEECVKLSVEALYEEVDNYGIGRMFLRKHLWEKGVVYLSGRDGIIGS